MGNRYLYSLNYDFESIKIPSKKPSCIAVFTGGNAPKPKMCSKFLADFIPPDYVIGADSGIETLGVFRKYFRKM